MNTITFEIREAQLCAELQVSKDELRRRREYFLIEGHHWQYVKKRVLLSPIGAQILRGTRAAVVPKNAPTADCGARRPVLALLNEKNPPAVKFAGRLVAWAMPERNERLVVCYVPGADPNNPLNLVSLRVRSNRNFLRGMAVPAEKGPGAGVAVKGVSEGVYELSGACPRWRGRW